MATYDRDFLIIDEDRSKLRFLKGERIERIIVYIRKPSDVELLAACAAVNDLELWGWQEKDFTALSKLAVRCLRLVRGRQMSLRGLNLDRLRRLWLQDCRHLTDLSGCRIPSLTMDACNRFDLDSLGAVEGLVSLCIANHKRIDSFDFVTACRELRSLSVGTHSLRTRNFKPLINAPRLEVLYVGWLKEPEIAAISKAKRRLFVAGAGGAMLAGAPAKLSAARRRQTFDKKYRLACI
jgi:hypothetical protein